MNKIDQTGVSSGQNYELNYCMLRNNLNLFCKENQSVTKGHRVYVKRYSICRYLIFYLQ